MTALRGGPEETAKLFGEWLTLPFRERLLANDTAALMACRRQRLVTDGFSDVIGTIAVPTLLYAGSADPIHAPARQSASEIPGAQFESLPGLTHIAAMFRSDLVSLSKM
jgi:pimeloyl-ACP methyl ester carboxylesterase